MTCNGNTKKTCSSCNDGYYLAPNKSCAACDTSCSTCSGPSNE